MLFAVRYGRVLMHFGLFLVAPLLIAAALSVLADVQNFKHQPMR